VGRTVKESVTTYLKVDYYAGEELSKDDGNSNLDTKNSGVYPPQLKRLYTCELPNPF
jgi:hypothetical protein